MTKGRIVYPILFILLCFSAYYTTMIETSGSVFPVQKNGKYHSLKEMAAEHFPESTYIRIYFQQLPDESPLQYYRELEECVEYFQQLTWTDLVISPTLIQDIKVDSMQFTSETIYTSTKDSSNKLDTLLHGIPLFSQFFLSHDRTGRYIYVFYPEGTWDRSYYHDINMLTQSYENRKVFPMGMEILEEHISRLGVSELGKLGIIAIFVILIMEIIIFRSLRYGILFSLVSLLPAVYVMSLFPLFKIPFSIFLIPVPILTLVLSTTYTLHIISYLAARPGDSLEKNLALVFPVVSAAAATTLFGFVTMLFSTLDRMRHLGILMTSGVILSLLVAWLALPPMIPGYLKRVKKQKTHRKIPMLKSVAAGLLFLALAGIFGILRFEDQHFSLERTVRNNPLAEYIKLSQKVTGASHQFTVIVNTGEEFGFISSQMYHSLIKVQERVADLSYISDILSITSLVNWINGKIEGSNVPVSPKDEVEIGESLELLFSGSSGFHPESLITPDYSAIRIQLLINAGGSKSWKSDLVIEDIRHELYMLFKNSFSESDIIVLSDAVQIAEACDFVKKGILTSLLLFYPIVFLFLIILFRSPFPAFVAVLPSLLSAMLYLGLMGYLGFYFSIVTSVSICMLIGVCIDDSVVLVQFFMKHRYLYTDINSALQESLNEVGSVIIKTTVIIVLGVSVLLFSSYREALQNSILLIITFLFANMLTLFFVPAVLAVNKKKKIFNHEK